VVGASNEPMPRSVAPRSTMRKPVKVLAPSKATLPPLPPLMRVSPPGVPATALEKTPVKVTKLPFWSILLVPEPSRVKFWL
jgi:hypothetical protein